MRRTSTHATVALVLLLALSLPAGAGLGAASAQDNYTDTIDEDNPLARDDAGTDYESDGYTGGDVAGYDLSVSVATDHESVSLDGFEYTAASDSMNHYLQIQYNEDIERTIRFYVASDIWHPHYSEVTAENDDVTASFTPVNGSDYTAVELTLSGQTDAVFQVPKAVSGYYYARDTGRSWLENQTGYELPSIFGGGAQWEQINPDDLTDTNDSVAIGTNESEPMIQYDTATDGQRWVPVPSCDSSRGEDAPICTYERPEDPEHIHVLANGSDPPPVRYKHGTDLISQTQASVNELLEMPSRLMDQINDLFGRGGS